MSYLEALWQRMLSIPSPIAPSWAPTPVAMRQEQFPNIPGASEHSRQEDVLLSSAYKRLVKTNNANVTRDYGCGPVAEHHDLPVVPLTADELALLGSARASIRIVASLVPAPNWRCDE